MKRSVLIVFLAALGVAVAAASAQASVPTVKTTVKITSGEGTEFKGKVSSAKKQCRANRTVKLYRKAESARATGDTLVGTAKTNASGVWEIEGEFIAAVYYARVSAVLVHANGATFRCSYAWTIPMHF